VRDWAAREDVEVIQIPVANQHREVADRGQAGDCDLIVSIGGDGTTLAAIREAVMADRPVLGVACGSLGVLTAVDADRVSLALDRFAEGDWRPRWLPALESTSENGDRIFAINDIVVVRAGQGQVFCTVRADGNLFGRIAGDGCIVSTPVGSSAYALAAGGPLLAVDADAYLFTPLPTHGGLCPPFVTASTSELELEITAGHGGVRLEVDGQISDSAVGRMTIGFRANVARLVSFADQEPFLTGLRRRRIITDSPRIVAEHGREDPC
jgi:NAD+ kinase